MASSAFQLLSKPQSSNLHICRSFDLFNFNLSFFSRLTCTYIKIPQLRLYFALKRWDVVLKLGFIFFRVQDTLGGVFFDLISNDGSILSRICPSVKKSSINRYSKIICSRLIICTSTNSKAQSHIMHAIAFECIAQIRCCCSLNFVWMPIV
ncbi:hypothetical protein EJ08DRAFT_276586 [Tothia fuscella]|uniref:Uncharacterized protein n=1 Tax=Tothia fuscella TaxID=1048955 RepID=A0A9P4NNY4_9PEZI|nr:hypothetical protein EJ08DRAFT_276586 [Tothia fuscella]